MRVIYVDVLAGVNLAMDYLLLAAAAKLSGAYCTRARLLAGAALGACYAVASCGVPFLTLLPVKAAAGFLMVRLCFGARSAAELVRLAALFYLVSCAAAGGALALGKVSDTTFFAGGGYYIDVPFRVVAAAGAVSWGLTGLLFPWRSQGARSLPRASGLRRAQRRLFPAGGHRKRPERPGQRASCACTRPQSRSARASG